MSRPASVFTPAMNAFGQPAPTPVSALGSYLSGTVGSLPTWAVWLAIGGLGYLGMKKKIPLWAAAGGAFALWYFMGGGLNTATLISGTGIMTDGTTVNLANASLVTNSGTGAQSVVLGGVAYPLLAQEPNPAGGTTYYLDNPVNA